MSQLKIKNGNSWESIPAGGVGVPSGGDANDFLVKSSSTDYATEWADFNSVFPITTQTKVVEISGNWEHLYIVFEKMGKLVVARIKILLTGASGPGIATWLNAIPSEFIPRNVAYPDNSSQSYIGASVERDDNGAQGQGTIRFWSDGSISYGINTQGVNGVYLSTHLTYFTD